MGERTEVSIEVDATPEHVYALIADLPSMGRWSPECVRCEWLGGATSASAGARFVGHNRNGWRRWSTKGTVVTAEPGRELTFDVHSVFNLPVSRWSYVITPRDGGVTLTESTEDRRGALIRSTGYLATGTKDRTARNRETMLVTLQRIKDAAEEAPAAAGGRTATDREPERV